MINILNNIDIIMNDSIIQPLNTPKQAVIFLHGYGANGHDLLNLSPYFEDGLDHTVFCSPNAPNICEQNSQGYQWFSLESWLPELFLKGAAQSTPYLLAYIKQIQSKYYLSESQITLIGFSQGAMMSLYIALNHLYHLKAVVSFSGMLLNTPDIKKSQTPLLLIHGAQDSIVPMQASIEAHKILSALNYQVQLLTIDGLAHSIDQKGLDVAQEFLQRCQKYDTLTTS